MNSERFDQYLSWLTPEKKQELFEMENEGGSFARIVGKVKEYFDDLDEEYQGAVRTDFKVGSIWLMMSMLTSLEVLSVK